MFILYVDAHVVPDWPLGAPSTVFPDLAIKIWMLNVLTAIWLSLLSDLPVNRAGEDVQR